MRFAQHILILFLLASVGLFGRFSLAESACKELLVPALGQLAPVDQLLRWEQAMNLKAMQKPSSSLAIESVLVAADQLRTKIIDGHPLLTNFFVFADGILWPQHPLNTDASVPFFGQQPVSEFDSFYSASRSVFLFVEDHLYSLKMPTNRPHPFGPGEATKAKLTDLAELSVTRSLAIKNYDEKFGESPNLKVLLDVFSLTEVETGSGIVVRDLAPLQDGHYYLPGFSIPFVGQQIADRFGADFQEFWGEHYAAAVGRAKAQLLLRYGLQMVGPNAQNILIQLDINFKPTGKVFFRDISDSHYFESVAVALGHETEVNTDKKMQVALDAMLDINTYASFWQMNESGLALKQIKVWEEQHDQAFIKTIVTELGLVATNYPRLVDIHNFFATDNGIALIKGYGVKNYSR